MADEETRPVDETEPNNPAPDLDGTERGEYDEPAEPAEG